MTSSSSKRRPFLKGAVVALAALAGCASMESEPTQGSPTATERETPTGTATKTETETETETEEIETETETDSAASYPWFIDRGEVFDSFAGFDEDWSVVAGEANLEGEGFLEGDSVRMDASDSTRARIARQFGSSKDLSGVDFSLAMKLHESTRESNRVSVVLKDSSGKLRYHSQTTLTTIADRWVRLDTAFSREDDGFDPTAVSELWIDHYAGEATSTFSVDDLRLIEKPKRGAVIFTFDDAVPGEYTDAYPTLSKYDYQGVCFPPSEYVSDDTNPSIDQYKEMIDDGWEIGGHTPNHERLENYAADEQLALFEKNVTQLREMGFVGDDEEVHFRTPFGNYDAGTLDVVSEVFATCISGAGSAAGSSFHITDPRMVGYQSGEDLEKAKQLIDKAAEHRQLLGLTLHMNYVDRDHIAALVEHVRGYEENGELDVLTMREFYERSNPA